MIAVNYSTLRENMKDYFDKVSMDKETMIVTRKDENVVVMSQSSYDSLMETFHLLKDQNNFKHLMKSIDEFNTGKGQIHELIEAEDDE